MANKLIFLSNNQSGSLKWNYLVLSLILAGLCYGVYNFGYDSFNDQKGTSVIATKVKTGNKNAILLPSNVTPRQLELLNTAYKIAKSDGHKHPELLQGLILQESNAGEAKNFRVAGDPNKKENAYYGVAQIKVAAAQDVMKQYPDMKHHLQTNTVEELQARLIVDDTFNIRVASKYLLMMGVNKTSDFALTAYNKGLGGARAISNHNEVDYTKSIKNYSQSPAIKNINLKLAQR